jgi:hypothetical protein
LNNSQTIAGPTSDLMNFSPKPGHASLFRSSPRHLGL